MTKMKIQQIVVVALALLASAVGTVSAIEPANTGVGSFKIEKSELTVLTRVNAMGGFTDLYVLRGDEPIFYARDVTGWIWTGGSLSYSTSPIYGVAGIWLFDPNTEATTKLVSVGKNAYVQLIAIDVSAGQLRYYYAPRVDKVKFETFRDGTKHVRSLDLRLR